MKTKKIIDRPEFVKSGVAVINTDTKAYMAAKNRSKKNKELEEKLGEIENLKDEIKELKDIILNHLKIPGNKS